MFIATAITNQSKAHRSETKGATYIALLRSCKRKPTGIYKHFIPTGFMCPRNSKTKKFALGYAEALAEGSREEFLRDLCGNPGDLCG